VALISPLTIMSALPYIDTDIDVDPRCKQYVNDLIEAEIQMSGGHSKLQKEYLRKLDGADAIVTPSVAPKPTNVVDLSRYELGPELTKQDPARAADRACVVLEYERMKQTNLLLIAQVGPDVWRAHGKNLDAEVAQQESLMQSAERDIASINLERERIQKTLGKELDDLNERWGSLAYSAAVLRGALQAREGGDKLLKTSVDAADVS